MCVKTRTVAKISGSLAAELGVSFKDVSGNYVVSLQLAQELEVGEYSIISANLEGAEGILPISPTKPIIRPRP